MNSEWRFQVWGADGTLSRIVTRPVERKALTDRDVQVIKSALLDQYRQLGLPAPQAQAAIDRMAFADHYPAFVLLSLGPQETFWVQHFRSGDELVGEDASTFDIQDLGSTDWSVFDAEGRYLGVVTFPGKYQPILSRGDRFYGIARDELDVQSLKVYRVVTGA